MLTFAAGAAVMLVVTVAFLGSRESDDSHLHPLLQATRFQRARNRAIGTMGGVFAFVMICLLAVAAVSLVLAIADMLGILSL